jgi:hypothetical protein
MGFEQQQRTAVIVENYDVHCGDVYGEGVRTYRAYNGAANGG